MTATLPVSGLIPRGAVVGILCGLGSVTVTAGAGEVIDAVNYVGNISMALGDTAEFIRIGNLWRLIGGTVALKYAAVMSGPHWTTQAQFDNTDSFATTKFVQRAIGSNSGFIAINSSRSLAAADIGKLMFVSGAGLTFTLPTPVSLGLLVGSAVTVFGTSNGITIVPGAGASLNSVSATVASISLLPGQSMTLVAIGTGQWQAVSSTCGLGQNADFASSQGVTGYQKLPGGLQECRGTFTASATPGAPVSVTFAQGFTAVHEVVITPQNAATATTSAWHDSVSTSGFNGRCNIASAVCHYVAKGIGA